VFRSWGATTDHPEFWNPKVRGAICFNPPAAKTFLPIYLIKTKLVLAGKRPKRTTSHSTPTRKPLRQSRIPNNLQLLKSTPA
jgi:hypothetical protein